MYILKHTETNTFVNADGDWTEHEEDAYQWETVEHVEAWMLHAGLLGEENYYIKEV